MGTQFKIGDEVSWSSEEEVSSGVIINIFTADFDYKGSLYHATQNEPQYEIKSHTSVHRSAHKESDLTKMGKLN